MPPNLEIVKSVQSQQKKVENRCDREKKKIIFSHIHIRTKVILIIFLIKICFAKFNYGSYVRIWLYVCGGGVPISQDTQIERERNAHPYISLGYRCVFIYFSGGLAVSDGQPLSIPAGDSPHRPLDEGWTPLQPDQPPSHKQGGTSLMLSHDN